MKNRGRGVHKPQTSPTGPGANSAAIQRQEIAESKRAELELRRMSRAFQTVSRCNQILVRAQNEQELLDSLCKNLVDSGGYRMAWVGYAEQDEAKHVRPVAHAGFEEGYLSLAQITWGEDERDADRPAKPSALAVR